MLDLLRSAVTENAGTSRWRISTSCSITGYRVYVDLGNGKVFRARGRSAGEAQARAAAMIVEWVEFQKPDPEDIALVDRLEASIAVARAKRGKPALRVIRGGKA